MKRLGTRLAATAPVLFLAACTEQEADAAARGFFNWMMVLVLIGVLAFILWALVLAGGIAAIISGVRRLNRDREPPPPPSMTPAGAPPAAELPPAGVDPTATAPEGAPPLPGPRPDDRRSGTDPAAIALIVFGGLLVLGAGPFVLFGNDASNGFFSVQIPLPMLILAAVLVYWGVKRSRDS